jgi:hypothetical protein
MNTQIPDHVKLFLVTKDELLTRINQSGQDEKSNSLSWLSEQLYCRVAYKIFDELNWVISKIDPSKLSLEFLIGINRYLWIYRKDIPNLREYWQNSVIEASIRNCNTAQLFSGIMDFDRPDSGPYITVVPKLT